MFTRKQFKVMVKHFDDMYFEGERLYVDVYPEDLYMMSENHVFRKKEFSVVCRTIVDGQLITDRYAKFMILRNDIRERQVDIADPRIAYFLDEGVTVRFRRNKDGESLADIFGVEEVTYARALRSASQFRTAKVLTTEADLVEAVRDHASYGWIRTLEGQTLKSVAKVEPYIGLALSSSLSAGTGFTDLNIDDFEVEMNIERAVTLDEHNNIIRYDQYVGRTTETVAPTDGQFFISPYAMGKIAFRTGIVSFSEWELLRNAFRQGIGFNDQLEDPVLGSIWNKIPRGVQGRYGLKKGFGVVYEHGYINPKTGKLYDLVFPSGSRKGEVKRFEHRWVNGKVKIIDHGTGVSDKDVHFCVTNVASLKEKKWNPINYQIVQALTLDFKNDIVPLVSKAMKHIMTALDSPEAALAFIGMVDNGDEEQFQEDTLATKLRRLLQANPNIFHTKWVQAQLKKLMMKSIQDMGRGKIPIEDGKYVFIVTDPSVLVKDGKPLLQAGEYYFNGETGKRAIFRSPLIHESEAVVIELVNRPELEQAFGHLKNILILNPFDDTLARMGGADTDGDKVYITAEPLIVNAVRTGLPLIYGDAKVASSNPIVWVDGGKKAIREYDLRTLTPSQIGTVTNYCTAIVDKIRDIRTTNQELIQRYWDLVTIGRVLQGRIIDDAKRGTTTRIDERLRVQWYPSWLGAGKNRYESASPMGRLYRWIHNVVLPAFKQRYNVNGDYRANLTMEYKNYNMEEVDRIIPIIQQLEDSYRQDVAVFFDKYGDGEYDPEKFSSIEEYNEFMEQRNIAFRELIKRHQDLLASIDASTVSIGLAAIHVAENMNRSASDKIPSYPYVVATDYVVAFLSGLSDGFKLVRVYDVDPLCWAERVHGSEGVLRSEKGVAGKVKYVNLEGEFQTFIFNDQYFIKVPVAPKQQEEVEAPRGETKMIQFELKGFKRFTGMSAEQIIPVISQKPLALRKIVNEKGRWLGVLLEGKQIGAVGKETLPYALFAEGKTMKVVHAEPIRGIVKVTAELINDEPVIVETEIPQSAPIVVAEQQLDLFDLTIGM